MLQIIMVGTRNGKPEIHWPGVFLGVPVMGALVLGTSIFTYRVLYGYFPSAFYMMATFYFVVLFMVLSIRRALKLPPETLRRLD